MGNMTNTFFDNLDAAATWSAGVAFKRSKALPLDKYSVFETKALAIEYAEKKGAYAETPVSYPGQVIAVAEGDKMVAYVLVEKADGTALELQPIGIIPTGDGKTINVTEDGQISLLVAEDSETVAGSQLTLQADGTIKWVKPDTTTAEGQTAAIKALEATVNGTTDEEGNVVTPGLVGNMETLLVDDADSEGSVKYLALQVVNEKEWGDSGIDKSATLDSAVIKIFENKEDIATLNGDAETEGSVDYKITTALEGTTFGTGVLDKEPMTLTEMADAIHSVEMEINDYTYTSHNGDQFSVYDLYDNLNGVADTADNAMTAAGNAQDTADEALGKINSFLNDTDTDGVVNKLKEIQEELENLGEAVELEEQFAAKADKVTGATAGNFAGLDANGNLTDSGSKASDFAAAVHTHTVEDIIDFPDIEGMLGDALNDYVTNEEINDKISQTEETVKSDLIGFAETDTATDNTIIGAKKYADSLATNYATAAQGAKADATATTIAGYGDIVTHNAAEFEAAGTAEAIKHELLGDTDDTVGPNTILGVQEVIGNVSSRVDATIAAIGTQEGSNALYDVQQGDADTLIAAKTYADGKDTAIAAAQAKGQQGINDAEAARQLAVAAQADADTNALNIQEIEKVINGYGDGEQTVEGLITKIANNTSRIATAEGTIAEHTTTIGNNTTAAQNAQTKADQAYTLAEGKTDLDAVKGLGYAEKTYVDTELAKKAVAENVYTKTEIDGKVNAINEELRGKADSNKVYEITEIDNFINTINGNIANKADADKVYTKTEIDGQVTAINGEIAKKADQTALDAALAEAKKYADDNDADTQYGIVYDSENKKIKLTNDVSNTEIDATAFIKDGMIEKVELSEDGLNLVITWNTDSGKTDVTTIPLSGLVDVYTGIDGNTIKVEVSDKDEISAEVKEGTLTNAHIATDAGIEASKLSAEVQASLAKADNSLTATDVDDIIDTQLRSVVKYNDVQTDLNEWVYAETITNDVGDVEGFTIPDGTFVIDKGHSYGDPQTQVLAIPVKGLKSAAFTEASAYATAAQGAKADTAVQSVTSLHDAIVVENTNGAVTINFATEIILNGGGADV